MFEDVDIENVKEFYAIIVPESRKADFDWDKDKEHYILCYLNLQRKVESLCGSCNEGKHWQCNCECECVHRKRLN